MPENTQVRMQAIFTCPGTGSTGAAAEVVRNGRRRRLPRRGPGGPARGGTTGAPASPKPWVAPGVVEVSRVDGGS